MCNETLLPSMNIGDNNVKSAEEVLTDALMRDLEENSDLDEVFDVDEEEEGAVEVEVDN